MNKKVFRFKKKYSTYVYLTLIIILALFLRTYNISWDNGYYFQPDERAIVMFTIPLSLPHSFDQFLSIQSPLNTHFFSYGTFPIYLLKVISEFFGQFNPGFKTYSQMYMVGRTLSVFFDTLTILLIFLIGKKVFSKKVGLFAALFYALSVFPIQISHFFIVDTPLSFFMLSCLYVLVTLIQKPKLKTFIFAGILFGLSLATKISALILGLSILLSFNFVLLGKKRISWPKFTVSILLFFVLVVLFFIIPQPYAILDFKDFLSQTFQQTQMSNNVFTFPYTLQYVGKVNYVYELKNIILWGQGPIIALINIFGLAFLIFKLFSKNEEVKNEKILLVFYALSYFLIFGHFAVGWMRYMLPVYPILCLCGGFLITELTKKILKKNPIGIVYQKLVLFLFVIILLIYPLSFLQIYNHPNTRIQASEWINKNIPYGSTLAIEHWDDALPVFGQQKYIQLTLPLYDPDTMQKWKDIDSKLSKSQYIIIASNRLYIPLQKLTNCKILPKDRCYPITARYYENLFSGKLGFIKVAQFTDYPTIPFTKIKIIDDTADESFTVYDHPKVMIFKKISQ